MKIRKTARFTWTLEKATEPGIIVFNREYVVLTPQNFEAVILQLTMESGKAITEDEDKCEHFDEFAEYYDEIPDICQGCGNCEGCYDSIDFDDEGRRRRSACFRSPNDGRR